MTKANCFRPLEKILIVFLLLVLSGCMTVSEKQTIVENTNSKSTFTGKKIAILPVKTQTSLAPDSVMALRREINKRLGPALQGKLPSSEIKDLAAVIDQLNQKNALPIFEDLISTYENTGVIDKRKTAALGQSLGSNFLLLSRLKAEKMDIIISRAMGASLELMLVNAETGEIAWGGTSEWKRGGIFGAGKTPPDEAAKNLVDLACESL
jgi:PBP1b-binding outer membrane lipoprotein LpoB